MLLTFVWARASSRVFVCFEHLHACALALAWEQIIWDSIEPNASAILFFFLSVPFVDSLESHVHWELRVTTTKISVNCYEHCMHKIGATSVTGEHTEVSKTITARQSPFIFCTVFCSLHLSKHARASTYELIVSVKQSLLVIDGCVYKFIIQSHTVWVCVWVRAPY